MQHIVFRNLRRNIKAQYINCTSLSNLSSYDNKKKKKVIY